MLANTLSAKSLGATHLRFGRTAQTSATQSSPSSSDDPARTFTPDEIHSLLKNQKRDNRFRKTVKILCAVMIALFGYLACRRALKPNLNETSFAYEPGSISQQQHDQLKAELNNPPAESVHDTQTHLRKLGLYARPLVVALETPKENRTVGSGFLYQGRYIVTNHHVSKAVAEKDGTTQIRLLDGQKLSAKIIGTDSNKDISVLEIDPKDAGMDALPSATISSDPVSNLDQIVAVGHPLGKCQWSTSVGHINSTQRHQAKRGRTMFQTDAAINPGNSGGPSFNLRGEVIGMNTQKPRPMISDNIAYMIGNETLKDTVDRMISNHEAPQPE